MNKRRAFLKKASAGVVITSLPAKSVWGACSVSGAMSGNLSDNGDRHDCTLPYLPYGRSPGFWKDVRSGVHGAFNHLSNVHDPKRSCYIKKIERFISRNSMELEPSLISFGEDDLYAALHNPGGLLFQLAAVYLNSYYGFYGLSVAGSKYEASQLVNQILLYFYTEYSKGVSNPIRESYWNFVDHPEPTSDYEVTTRTGCSI